MAQTSIPPGVPRSAASATPESLLEMQRVSLIWLITQKPRIGTQISCFLILTKTTLTLLMEVGLTLREGTVTLGGQLMV